MGVAKAPGVPAPTSVPKGSDKGPAGNPLETRAAPLPDDSAARYAAFVEAMRAEQAHHQKLQELANLKSLQTRANTEEKPGASLSTNSVGSLQQQIYAQQHAEQSDELQRRKEFSEAAHTTETSSTTSIIGNALDTVGTATNFAADKIGAISNSKSASSFATGTEEIGSSAGAAASELDAYGRAKRGDYGGAIVSAIAPVVPGASASNSISDDIRSGTASGYATACAKAVACGAAAVVAGPKGCDFAVGIADLASTACSYYIDQKFEQQTQDIIQPNAAADKKSDQRQNPNLSNQPTNANPSASPIELSRP